MRVRLGPDRATNQAHAFVRQRLEWEPPMLPGLAPGTVRRWEGMPTWQPPETVVLSRHRAVDRPHWIVDNRRDSPEGYVLEYELGLVQRHEQPGTARLVERDGGYAVDDESSQVTRDVRVLGHVEQAPFPMMDVLELRRVRATGQLVLVAGAGDPLREGAEPVATLGFLESFPIQPKRILAEPPPPRNLALLVRSIDRERWRHDYDAVAWAAMDWSNSATVSLGSVRTFASRGFVELRRLPGGRIATKLLAPAPAAVADVVRAAPRWVAAPLAWSRRPHGWAVRAAASRARHAVRMRATPADGDGDAAVLGYLRSAPEPGYSPLYSARHPVLGDQFVTRSELEARDLGYWLEGVLGYVGDVGADRHRGPGEILWGSRFGHRRRYVEGDTGSGGGAHRRVAAPPPPPEADTPAAAPAPPAEEPVHTRFPLGHYYSPVYDPRELAEEPRRSQIWPPQPRDTAGVDWREQEQVALCTGPFAEQQRLRFIDDESADPTEYFTSNDQYPALDAWALEAMIRHHRPKRFVEVGSGFSSLVTARVNRELFDGAIDFVCVEPYPRRFLVDGVPGIGGLRVEKVQDTPLDVFTSLRPDDILFVDTSHVVKTGGDVPWIYNEVLPRLAPGVVVHIHDICVPGDYPSSWVLDGWGWNETYLVHAFLTFNAGFAVRFSSSLMVQRRRDALLRAFPDYGEHEKRAGSSLWVQRV